MHENPIRTPIFAILPADAPEQLLCMAAEAAADFAIWPARNSEILQRIARILGEQRGEVDVVRDLLCDEIGFKQLVGEDPAFLRMIGQIPLLARSNRPLLITGETGTGKELCARAVHHLSKRRNFPFIPVDCGAFPDHLFENEMFGHMRGAFTDAHREQRGLVAIAEGGTLFLDEIDSLSLSAQAKLLRFLQERTYRPLGSDKFAHADVNVLAATNRDLEGLVRHKQFRVDLFFRLNVLRLHTMPLRERPNDIPILARHFLDTLCAEEGIPRKSFAPTTLMALQRSEWPGNVRELYNVVQRAFVFARGSQVLPTHIAPDETVTANESCTEDGGFRVARARAIEEFERYYVIEILRAHNGNITQAARSAHQDRRAFGRLVKRHRIDRRSI
jgi:DNA-binding NtrC family response regulator